MIGQTISHYKILEKLGEGGMGVVYKAEDFTLKREVALKFLPPHLTQDPVIKKRFIQEARAASSLDHPNICTIHEIGETADGQTYLVMACYEGETLQEKISQGPLSVSETLNIARQMVNGLAKAHEKGIIHRDIKPSNIFITRDDTVKIIDFGLAKLAGLTQMTREGTTLGTTAYLSPEQARGDSVDQRSDIWSLGVVCYEMLTGLQPFHGEYEQSVLYNIFNEDPEPISSVRTGIPLETERLVNKMLAKNPGERYQHMDEILVDLQRIHHRYTVYPAGQENLSDNQYKNRSKSILLTVIVGLALVSTFLLLRPLLFDETIASDPRPIAVIAFENQTGDPSYDYLRAAIPNLLITSLEQSKYLRVMTWERMKDVLKQMGKTNESLLDKDLGYELCQREGVSAIIIGSFVKAGNTFATDVKVLDVETKELLKSVSARGEGVQSILDTQIDHLSREVARGIGLSKNDVETVPANIVSVTTSSLEAYNWFLRGRQEFEAMNYIDARQSLEQAVALDTNFVIAYYYLSNLYGAIIETGKSIQFIKKARSLLTRAPEKEQLLIESRYTRVVENNFKKCLEILTTLVKKYPEEKRFHYERGMVLKFINRNEEAETEYKKAIQLDPEFAVPVNQLAYIYAEQGRFPEALQTLKRYAALSPGDANPYDSMGEIYLKMGDLDVSLIHYEKAIKLQPAFYPSYASMAYVFGLQQKYEQCWQYLDDYVKRAPTPALKASFIAWKAVFMDLLGRDNEALYQCSQIKQVISQMEDTLAFAPPYYWTMGWILLAQNDLDNARIEFDLYNRIHTKVEPQYPVYHVAIRDYHRAIVNFHKSDYEAARSYLGEVRKNLKKVEILKMALEMNCGLLEAELLLAEGQPRKAIQVYRNTPESMPALIIGFDLPMYNIPSLRDVIPRAFLQLGELDSAIVAYKQLLHINPDDQDRRLIPPLYHYRLAKVYEKADRIPEAKSEFARFLELWQNADADRPELIDAKKRFAELSDEI